MRGRMPQRPINCTRLFRTPSKRRGRFGRTERGRRMSASLPHRAVRLLQGEARRLIQDEGVLNHNEVLRSIVDLHERVSGRPRRRMTGKDWRQVCNFVETAYTLGLCVGAAFTDLRTLSDE